MRTLRVAACVLLLAALTNCDGGTHLNGTVKNREGKALPEVRVILSWVDSKGANLRSYGVTTEDDGRYSVGFMHSPFKCALVISAEKPGYTRYEKHFYSNEQLRTLDIVLDSAPNARH